MLRYDEVNWDLAACRGLYTDLFYQVEEERSKIAYYYINAVRMTCTKCQIWDRCLEYAFKNEQYGVWGGLTSQERLSFSEPEKYERQRVEALMRLMELGINLQHLNEIFARSGVKPKGKELNEYKDNDGGI